MERGRGRESEGERGREGERERWRERGGEIQKHGLGQTSMKWLNMSFDFVFSCVFVCVSPRLIV